MFIFPFEQLPHYQNWAFREKFFSPDECDRVLAFLNSFPPKDVVMRTDEGLSSAADLRRSCVAMIPWIKDAEWIYQRLAAAVLECNKAIYNFQLSGIVEGIQIDQYPTGGFFDWHQDFGPRESSIRKLSLIAQLSDANQYQGGDLELFSGRGPQKAIRTRGSLMIFPSFVPQRITPITGGTRNSLLAWVSGPAFK